MQFSRRKRRLLWFSGSLLMILLLAFLFRGSILRGAGQYLIVEHELQQADVIFVLGGNPFDRGAEGARLLNEGWASGIICTGGNKPQNVAALGMDYFEAQVTRQRCINSGAAANKVEALNLGTSTKEEADHIVDYMQENGLETAIVVSDLFHTSRISWVFEDKFEEAGLTLILRGAPSTQYDESNWWQDESGLIMVNNEYIKKIYYWWKY